MLSLIFRFVCVRSAQLLTAKAKCSANIPLTLTGKPNPAQITLWHKVSPVGLIIILFFYLFIMKFLNKCLN